MTTPFRLSSGRIAALILAFSIGVVASETQAATIGSTHDHDHDHGEEGRHGTFPGTGMTSGAMGGDVVTQSIDVNAIFSQASFGMTPIEIRFLDPISQPGPTSVTTETQLDELFGLGAFGFPVINAFYVDTLDYCADFNANIIGCANTPGNIMAVERGFMAGNRGAELMAHEIGHNTGLLHPNPPVPGGNLMNPSIDGNSTLTMAQVDAILMSNLVQTDEETMGFFIEVQPIDIFDASIPVPASALLLVTGLFGLARIARRRPG